jgi:hypothetical protein
MRHTTTERAVIHNFHKIKMVSYLFIQIQRKTIQSYGCASTFFIWRSGGRGK